MKATTLLERQHRKVEATFKKLEGRKGDAPALLLDLANDLCAHMAIEQTIFYPAIVKVKKDLVFESYEEHAVAELALKRLLATDPADVTFIAKVTTLKELIEHHVEEEEQEMFPAVEKALGDAEMQRLGGVMKAAFETAIEAGYEAALSRVFAKTTADAQNKPAKAAQSAAVAKLTHNDASAAR
jgi:iron-sulfur cluster repair protein YtfE (RIC family)